MRWEHRLSVGAGVGVGMGRETPGLRAILLRILRGREDGSTGEVGPGRCASST